MNRTETQLLPGAPIQTDGYLRRAVLGTIMGYLIAGAPIPTDSYLRRWAHEEVGVSAGAPAFPTQFSGLRLWDVDHMIELCLVAEADAVGGLRIDKNGITYGVYLVDTSDGNASPLRIRTGTGTKAVRLKT